MPPDASAAKPFTPENHVEIFDSDFKWLYTVPSRFVVHTPPARLNISRFVICRNYKPHEPGSCSKEENCRFVHANVDYSKLEGQSIHVNYIWRHEDMCTYERLPPGQVFEVFSRSDGQKPDLIPSERILVTRRAMSCLDGTSCALSHCAHYYCSRMCNRGEDCNFIHAVYVDPNVRGEFKRAPPRPMSRLNPFNESSQIGCVELDNTPWLGHFNAGSPSYGCGACNNHVATQLVTKVPSPDYLPVNELIGGMNSLCITTSQSSDEGDMSVPQDSLFNKNSKKDTDSLVGGDESFRDAHLSIQERSLQSYSMGVSPSVIASSVIFPLVLPVDPSRAPKLFSDCASGISRNACRALEASGGQALSGRSYGSTASPPTSVHGVGSHHPSFIPTSPTQVALDSPYEVGMKSWNSASITSEWVNNKRFVSWAGRPRTYRHNPYELVNSSREESTVEGDEGKVDCTRD